jgi:glycosyltransferase involved in cell wall biosynthesis
MPGLDIRRTARLPWRTDYEVGSSRHKIAFDVYLAAQSLREALRVRPDVIHGHMHEGALIGGILARLLGVPLVFDFQGSMTSEMVDHQFLDPNGRVFALARRMEKGINAALPDAILTSSLQAADLLQQDFQVRADKIHALPDCADTGRFYPGVISEAEKAMLRHELGIPAGRTIVAYLGLLTDYQGTPYLIETAVRLKAAGEAVHFLIMGYPNVEHYRELAQQRDVEDVVTFTGKVEYRDAPRYLALGDIAVAPKLSATEGSGKILNYMAMAQPVVAFDTPVNVEYLGDLGVYAPAGDVEQFTEALRGLIHDPARRGQLGEALRRRAFEEYSWPRAAQQIEALYYQLTSQ